ncbi:hypothetical protein MMC32_006179 [Xylographa parallela]|nr:hypothetical protein [Xylographa parallela]
MSSKPIGQPPKDLEGIAALENSLVFRSFTSDTAFAIGMHIRNRLLATASKPAVVSVSFADPNQLLFHACSKPGTTHENETWITRKRKTVLRWDCSSYLMNRKFGGDEQSFADTYALGAQAGEYAIYGGGVPARVEGREGVVAVILVSGLAHEDDHMVIIEAMEDYIREMKKSGDFSTESI